MKTTNAARIVLSARCHFAPWHNAAIGVSFRQSVHSWTGMVAVSRFSSREAATRFAAVWSVRTAPGFCAIRKSQFGFLVSVPVPKAVPKVGRGKASRRIAAVIESRIAA